MQLHKLKTLDITDEVLDRIEADGWKLEPNRLFYKEGEASVYYDDLLQQYKEHIIIEAYLNRNVTYNPMISI